MSTSEWNRFLRAYDTVSSREYRGFPSEIDHWTRVHLDHVPDAHGTPQFFPWHRFYVRAFEQLLQREDPGVTIPYWDWSADWSEPWRSPIFARLDIGDCKYRRQLPSPHCLRRSLQRGTAFYSFRAMERAITNSRTYVDLWRTIEPAPHGIVHSGIGGRSGDMTFMWSPNDPIFWLHHTMIDKLWADWQDAHPRRRNDYGGRTRRGRTVRDSDILSPFNLRVDQSFNYRNLCYYYEPARRAYQSRSNRQRNLKAAIKHILPTPLSIDVIHHHQMNETEVRQSEKMLARWMLQAHRESTTIDSPSTDKVRRTNEASLNQLVRESQIERVKRSPKNKTPFDPTNEPDEDHEPRKMPRKTDTRHTGKKPRRTTPSEDDNEHKAEEDSKEERRKKENDDSEEQSEDKKTEENIIGKKQQNAPKIQSDPKDKQPAPPPSNEAQNSSVTLVQPNLISNLIATIAIALLLLSI